MTSKAGAILVAVAVSVACVAIVVLLQTRADEMRTLASLEQRIAGMEKNQLALQSAFLDGSRASRSRFAESVGYRLAQRDAGGVVSGMRLPTPAEIQKTNTTSLEKLEKAFDAEPINAAWSGKTRQDLENVIYQIARQGTLPRAMQIDCRSRSCQIDLNLADTGEIDTLTEPLLTEIAGYLPSATMIQIPSPDGQRIDLHIFAEAPVAPGHS